MNLFILDKEYNKIGILSNQGAAPIAPFFDDMYTQELSTGADTYEFSTIYTYQTQELLEIGNHIIFEFDNEHKLFVIVDVTYSHKNGKHTIDVYAEGIGFELLERYVDKFEVEGSFKNLLDIILVGTGWKHEESSKLVGIRKMKYDGEKNILAIIQDAIKEYDGAEVKFEVDYSDNKIKKKVHVYENGGRGSFVGYRFEYGINVNGVTKKEEIANSKDDTVVFTNDNDIDILLEYNVDVAMRSEEIVQFDIGDTHYVIDHDFTPPLLLEARIGKIEISFSDPTKNKLYLANFKNATGAISSKTNKDDMEYLPEHTHPLPEHTHPIPEHTHPELGGGSTGNNDLFKAPRIHSYEFLLYTNRWGSENFSVSERMNDYGLIGSAGAPSTRPTPAQLYDFITKDAKVYECSPHILDEIRGIRKTNYCLRLFPQNYCSYDDDGTCTMSVAASRVFSDIIKDSDVPDFEPISKSHFDNHMLDVGSLACATITALQHHIKNDNHGLESQFFELATDVNNGSTAIKAKHSVWFSYGIRFNTGAVNHSDHIIDEAHTIKTKYLRVNGQAVTSDISLKENIRYLDAPVTYSNNSTNVYKENLETRDYSTEDLLEKADLYDFIVNQVNICEYNFIGDTDNKIGFIANDYEGTKVGDKIVSVSESNKYDDNGEVIATTESLVYDPNNLLFATIGALQEEVRIRDEKIASLEDRLAKIEAMLGIDN